MLKKYKEKFLELPQRIRVGLLIGLAMIVILVLITFMSSLFNHDRKDTHKPAPSTSHAPASTEVDRGADLKEATAPVPDGLMKPDGQPETRSLDDKYAYYNAQPLTLNDKGLPEPTKTDDPIRYMADFARAAYTFDTTKASYSDYAQNLSKWQNSHFSKKSNGSAVNKDIFEQANEKFSLMMLNDVISDSDTWDRYSLQGYKSVGKVSDVYLAPQTGTSIDTNPVKEFAKDPYQRFGKVSVTGFTTMNATTGQAGGVSDQPDSGHSFYLFSTCPSTSNAKYKASLDGPLTNCTIDNGYVSSDTTGLDMNFDNIRTNGTIY